MGHFVPDVVVNAFKQIVPGLVPAEGEGCLCTFQMSVRPTDPAGRGAEVLTLNSGGSVARPGVDGLNATAFPSGVMTLPIEATEHAGPVIIWRKELRPGSGRRGRRHARRVRHHGRETRIGGGYISAEKATREYALTRKDIADVYTTVRRGEDICPPSTSTPLARKDTPKGNAMADGFNEIETAWIPMPDGIKLAARIWTPHGSPSPAVLEYLPYRRRDGTSVRDASVYPAFAAMGLAGVRVDIRGTGCSDGHFDDEYSESELADGEAVIAWIAAQPWCDGNVGMMGISWCGFDALQLAARRPPALKTVISIASTVDRFSDDIHFKGGAHLSANLYWATQMLGRAAMPPDAAVVGDAWRNIWLDRLEHLPALMFPWMAHQRRDAFWQHGSICEDFSALEAPALMIAGWADGYRNTPWDARAGLGAQVRSITGPWVHLYPHFAVPEPRLDFIGEAERWFGRWLQGRDTGAEDLPAHRLYLADGVRADEPRAHDPGRWVEIAQNDATETILRLSPGRLGQGAFGTTNVRTPQDCGVDGGDFFTQGADTDLPDDQRADDGMSMCFETDALETALDIIGRPTLQLPVTIDAPQGNLVARLVDVHPDGAAHRISLGVLNLSHRNVSGVPAAMTPGRAEEVTVTLDATAYRVRPGHKLQLAVSTTYYPMILPPPTDVTATLDLDSAALHLPSASYHEITVPDVGPDTRSAVALTPSSAARRVTRDRASGVTEVVIESDSGRARHPEHGMEWRDIRHSDYAIARGDPLSYRAVEVCTNERTRDGVATRVTATGRLRATASDWVIKARIETVQDGEIVFERDWADTIARDHM